MGPQIQECGPLQQIRFLYQDRLACVDLWCLPMWGLARCFLCNKFAFCIKTGWFVWIHGVFPCVDWPDVCIFHHGFKNMLGEKEHVEADDGHIGEDPKHIKVPKGIRYKQNDNQHTAAALARHHHETGNHLLT